MKKFFFSLVAAMMAATATYAQSSMLATLSHDGEISTYYGAAALKEAYNAAAEGDVITLSSGTFVAVDIKKALTIRGAGMGFDQTNQSEPTVITGDFTIEIPETTKRLTLEGLYNDNTITYRGTLTSATFLKDRFSEITYYNATGSHLKNATFVHCKIMKSLYLSENSSASCLNCLIWNPSTYSSLYSNFEFINCNLCNERTGSAWSSVSSSSFKNCILMSGQFYRLHESNTAYNCVYIDNWSDFFYNMPNATNMAAVGFGIFKDFEGGVWLDDSSFELTDEAKAQYKGLDGTEVGMFGGNMPFDATPTNPQITKCNVAAKSTADGKLSVDITVQGAE